MRSPRAQKNLGWARGVNLLVDPQSLPDDALANGYNCWPTIEGILAKRHAVAYERVISTDALNVWKPIAMFAPDPVTGFDLIIHYVAAGIEYIRAVRFDGATADAVVQVAAGAPNNYRPVSFANYRGAVIAVGAGNEGFFQLTQSSATQKWAWHKVSFNWTAYDPTATQTQTIAVKPNVVGVYRDRLMFGDFGPGMHHWIVVADRSGPWAYAATHNDDDHRDNAPLWSQIGAEVLASNGRHIEIVKLQGQTVRALEEVSTRSVANALQTALLVLTDTRCAIVTGEVAETTDPANGTYDGYIADFAPAIPNMDCGIAGVHTFCRTPNGFFWASGEDVYALYDGAPKPVVLGTSIRPALRACPNSFQPFWHMAYADGAVFLSVATSDSSDELNLVTNHWRLDLRPTGDGDEIANPAGAAAARWWGPQDYSNVPNAGLSGHPGYLGVCILAKRGADNQDTVFGLYAGYGDLLATLQCLFLVSFNRVFDGRDIPYREVSSARTWTRDEDVVAGDVVSPSPLFRNGYLYVYTQAGHTGNIEPVWPAPGSGIPFNDGTAKLLELGFAGAAYPYMPPNANGNSGAQNIAMKPDFKEHDMGSKARDDVFRRADVSAYFGAMQQAWLEIALNGGNTIGWAGPCVIGQPPTHTGPAGSELGSLVLDLDALSDEFQARRLSPSGTGREQPGSFAPGVVRGRTMQPKFREGNGFVIDSTNDHIVWGATSADGRTTLIFQAALDQGYYPNIDALIANIVQVMDAATPVGAMGGFTVAANPWSSNSAFFAVRPYTTNILLNFTARGASTILFFVSGTDKAETATYLGAPCYIQRSQRLMALLGYDTTTAWETVAGAIANPIAGGLGVTFNGENFPVTTTPAVLWASQSVPYKRSTVVAITELVMETIYKAGRPLGLTGRKS